MTADEIATKLCGRRSGRGWMARCPAHDDRNPSLSIAEGEEGRTLLKCQAGCATDRVVATAGLTLADLFAEKAQRSQTPRTVASFLYIDENGKPLARIDRNEPGYNGRDKDFLPHLALPDGGFATSPGLNGAKLPLYHLPELRAAIAAEAAIYLVEGEGKADALREALRKGGSPAAATTIAGGASAPMTDEHVASFSGSQTVVILADSDAPGRKAAKARAQRIISASPTCDVRVLDLYPERRDGRDVANWLSDHGLGELLSLASCAPRVARAVEVGGYGVGALVTVRASEVSSKRILWFANDRIPFGAVTLFDGPGDLGKTTTLMGIIAAGSVGHSFLDNSPIEPVTALIVAEEDNLGVLKMRLQAAGGDLNRVHFVTGVRVGDATEPFSLPKHVPVLEHKIQEIGARLVYVDALFSHLELDGEGRMSQQVRHALRPIVEMVDRTGVAFTALRHWVKAIGPAALRALGSVELGNVARSILSFGRHPEAEDRYVIAVTKHNLSRLAPTVAYRIDIETAHDDDGQTCEVTRVALEGEVRDVTADDLAMRQPGDPEDRSAAQDWLEDYLSDGLWHDCADVQRAARKDGAGSPPTLRRAASRLGVEKDRSGFPSRSKWRLRPERSQIAHSQGVIELEQSGDRGESLAFGSEIANEALEAASNLARSIESQGEWSALSPLRVATGLTQGPEPRKPLNVGEVEVEV
jgi:putative DNA primase/helicase